MEANAEIQNVRKYVQSLEERLAEYERAPDDEK